MNLKTTNSNNKRQRGFSLVEVLIALVIMSIGMLGIAGLYVQSLQAGRTSMLRHHAVTLAGDVADRIRANPTAGAAYVAAGANNNCVAAGTDCNPAEMAGNDVLLWNQQAGNTLPGGNVVITFTPPDAAANTPPIYQIDVRWTEPEGAQNFTITIPVLGV
ncbi:MAG: type IV pilus modification protein PilV [Gammaproteobacteria bacterium]|nr:type IV pilus modification protein PilV [Gammaproteobacteria bacterium]